MTLSDAAISVRFAGTRGGFRLDVGFEAPLRGITALFGPSGAGKTTILRCIAGLERIRGHLSVGDQVWQSAEGAFREAHRRPVGYVFQEPSLFSHLSVRKNLEYGQRRTIRGPRRATLGQKRMQPATVDRVAFDDVVDLMGIGHLLDRMTHDLSGGERQRIAIGRALLSQPRLLLMDEPLAALDRESKEEILPYLEALHADLEVPILYVSHDRSEVERLADVIVIVDRGAVTASGPISEVLTRTHLPIARDPHAAVVLDTRVRGFDPRYHLTELAIGEESVWVPGTSGTLGDARRIRVAAADVSLATERPSRTSILNVLAGRIAHIEAVDEAQVTVVVAVRGSGENARLLARVSRRATDTLGLHEGQFVFVQVKAVSIVASGAPKTGTT